MTFERQNKNIPYCFNFVKNLYKNCKLRNSYKILFAKYKDKIIAANFLVYDKKLYIIL